jgi:hypothetical protein
VRTDPVTLTNSEEPLNPPDLGGGGNFGPIDSTVYAGEPGDNRVWLPGNTALPAAGGLWNATDKAALDKRDADIENINREFFAVDPALAWRPSGAELFTGTNISTLHETHAKATEALGKLTAAVDALKTALSNGAVEQHIGRQRDLIGPGLDAFAASAAAAKTELPKQLQIAGEAANNGFQEMRGENLDVRRKITQLMGSATSVGERGAALPDVNRANTALASNGVTTAVAAITALTGNISAPGAVEKQIGAAPPGNAPPAASVSPVSLSNVPPGALTPVENTNTTPGNLTTSENKNSTNEIAKLLGQLANTAVPLAQQAAQLPQQAAAPLAQQAAGIPQQVANAIGRNPNDILRQLSGGGPQNAKLANAEQAAAAKDAQADRAAATQVAFTAPKPAEAAALGAPGSPARPNQLDATGKPADKDGDGKVDADAVPLSKSAVKPFDLSVPVDGQNVMVKGITDPRVGEMMLNMADARAGDPMSVLDATRSAGMNIQALGDPLDPDQAKVGDAVIGDTKSGLFLGDGKVLTSSGQVENMNDVLGESGFVSQIPLPELPDTPPADKPGTITIGDTSPSAANNPSGPAAVSAPETGPPPEPATSPPQPPISAAAPPATPAPAAPAPAPTPAAPAPPVAADTALLAAESPVPAGSGPTKKVPYEGQALGG